MPANILEGPVAKVEFELDRTFLDHESGRAHGLMVRSVELSNLDSAPVARERLRLATRDAYERNRQRRNVPISASQDQELMKLFHETPIWRNFRFHAIQIEKSPLDLWNMQEAIQQMRPDFIVETGTYHGGSALFWANALNGLGLTSSRVLTVDVSEYRADASQDPLWTKYVEFLQGSSTDPDIVAKIAAKVRGHRTLITLDSDHSAPHVLRELRMYSPLVSSGSYLVVEDTDMDGVPAYPASFPGPMAAVTQFLREGGAAQFEPDRASRWASPTTPAGGCGENRKPVSHRKDAAISKTADHRRRHAHRQALRGSGPCRAGTPRGQPRHRRLPRTAARRLDHGLWHGKCSRHSLRSLGPPLR